MMNLLIFQTSMTVLCEHEDLALMLWHTDVHIYQNIQ